MDIPFRKGKLCRNIIIQRLYGIAEATVPASSQCHKTAARTRHFESIGVHSTLAVVSLVATDCVKTAIMT